MPLHETLYIPLSALPQGDSPRRFGGVRSQGIHAPVQHFLNSLIYNKQPLQLSFVTSRGHTNSISFKTTQMGASIISQIDRTILQWYS